MDYGKTMSHKFYLKSYTTQKWRTKSGISDWSAASGYIANSANIVQYVYTDTISEQIAENIIVGGLPLPPFALRHQLFEIRMRSLWFVIKF